MSAPTWRMGDSRQKGFTLVELIIATAVTLVVLAAIFMTYKSQQDSYVSQEQVAEMQQNLRAAFYMMARDVRMAGYDPTGVAGAGMVAANANNINFTMDITGGESDGNNNDGDGQIDEADEHYNGVITDIGDDITYSLAGGNLVRNDLSGNQIVANNIDWLDFEYLDWQGNVTATLTEIRSVQITLVARAGRTDRAFTNNLTYQNQQLSRSYAAPGDNFRRRVLSTTIRCRNMGI